MINEYTFKVQLYTDEELMGIINHPENHEPKIVAASMMEARNRDLFIQEEEEEDFIHKVIDENNKVVTSFDFVYGNTLERFFAYLIDGIMLFIPIHMLISGMELRYGSFQVNLTAIIVGTAYYVLMEGSEQQATIGKSVMGLKVVRENGKRMTYGIAAKRHLFKIISILPLGLGILAIIFDKRNQAWHDAFTSCYVIRKVKS